MYCQSCGASNSDDAKFCNQCGGRIARPGDAGGPAPVGGPGGGPSATAVGMGTPAASGIAAPSSASASAPASVNVWEQQQTSGSGGGPSMMSVSLDTIGVRSTKKVWAGIALVALLLVGLGALGSWLLRGEPEVVAEAGHAQPEDPFVIGTPLPPSEVPTTPVQPVDDPATDTSPRSAMTGSTSTGSTRTDTHTSTTMTGSSTGTTGSSAGSTSMAGNDSTTSMSSTGTTSMAGATGDTSTMGSTDTGTSVDPGTSMDTGTSTGSTGGTGTIPNLGGDLPEERDLELELYGSRVRFVVQRYYVARAQTCFDHATRNNPNVSGTVVVNMTIGADGNVSDTSVARNTTGDEVLGNCLRSQVASWQLPPPPGGSLQMQMPFSR